MKRAILIAAIIMACSFASCAQQATTTTTTTNSVLSLVNQGLDWIGTPDTNNTTLETTKLRLETGPVVQSGATIADEVFIQYNVGMSNRLALISQTDNASVAGTIVSQGLGLGYNVYQKYDTEAVAYVSGNWGFKGAQIGEQNKLYVEMGAKLRHMLNKTMYIAPGVAIDLGGKSSVPKITAEAGWAF
jgi:hypothetical protein